jgi:hypothetical protein
MVVMMCPADGHYYKCPLTLHHHHHYLLWFHWSGSVRIRGAGPVNLIARVLPF